MLPTTIIPLIAFVTDIRGVCKAGVTFQITMYPAQTASTNVKNLYKKSESVENPIKMKNEARPTIDKISDAISLFDSSSRSSSNF